MTAGPKPRPPLLRLKPAAEAKPAKPEPAAPADTLSAWRPAGNVLALRAQLPDLLADVPPVFSFELPVPLALGVLNQLAALARPGTGRTRVRRWLAAWCRRPIYLEALAAEGSMRHDLDGQSVEPVSDRHRAAALEALAARHPTKPRRSEASP